MTPSVVTVRVPATTANLGSGFDCLALALDLWNTCTFTVAPGDVRVEVAGEGAGQLPVDAHNLIARTFFEVYRRQGQLLPVGVRIGCENCIPLGSGLGSSAAAVVAGIAGANTILGNPLTLLDMLRIANELEGHADNAAAALFGGLMIVTSDSAGIPLVQKIESQIWQVVAVLPDFALPTVQARRALPAEVSMRDAVFNIGHSLLAVEALRMGDRGLLFHALEDRLHQPYRLKLIPGAEAAMQAARTLGAPAALSGAGPSIVAFPDDNPEAVQSALQEAFREAGMASRGWILNTSFTGLITETG
ncbi:MAG: homoserine kinase [Bellilinea sp.]